MSALKIQQFGGMLPAWDDALLPVSQAADSQNGYLFSGALIGWRAPKLLRTLTDPNAKAVFRVPTLTRAKATATLTFLSNANKGDTVKVGEAIYTFTDVPTLPFDIVLGPTAAISMSNLLAALNIGINPTADAANVNIAFMLGTEVNPAVSSVNAENFISGSTLTVTAPDYGLAYNATNVTESTGGVRLSWNAATFTGGTNSTFDSTITGAATWLEFEDHETDVVRSPIVDDKFNRLYMASPSLPPKYNTYDRIVASSPHWLLGLPPPGCAPGVTPSGGGDTLNTGRDTSVSVNVFAPGANTIFLMPLTPSGAIDLQDVQCMPAVTNPTANFQGAVYADNAGAPGALISAGATVTGCVSGSPIISTFGSPVSLLAATKYWIGFITDSAVAIQLADDLNNAGVVDYPFTYSNGPPPLVGGGTLPVTVTFASSNSMTISTPTALDMPQNTVLYMGTGHIVFTTSFVGAGNTVIPITANTTPIVGSTVKDLTNPLAIVAGPVPPGTPIADLQIWSSTLTGAQLETRAYVYTWVSAYDEESPPSPPTVVTGWSNAVWKIDMFEPPADDMGVLRNITKKRIYRTISAVGGQTDYFLVTPDVSTTGGVASPTAGDLDVTLASFNDSVLDDIISLNVILPSATWFPPPEGLEGIESMPNGMLVGFKGNELWFCDPYRPHAWPPGYVITTEFPIIGIGVTGNSVVAATSGTPYLATGINPGSMSQTKVLIPEPCNSRGSVVGTLAGVYYTSPNGLISVTGYGIGTNITEAWITREKWRLLTPPLGLHAIPLASCYFAFGVVTDGITTYAQQGFTIQLANDTASFTIWPQPGGHRLGFNKMTAPNAKDTVNLQMDPWTGIGLLIQNGGVYYYDFTDQAPTMTPYKWRSKVYQQPSKKNFEAMKIFFSVPPGTPAQGARNTAATNDASWNTLGANQYGIIRVYADYGPDDTLLLVTTREIYNSGELLRILSGFKAERWQWEIEGRVNISNLQVATSARELGGV